MNPKSSEARHTDEKPFEGMIITENTLLSGITGRSPCPQCGKSRKYFCYTCFVPVAELEGRIPYCKLPIKIDIIKHKKEIDGKSTAAHAAVLAPDDVRVYTYPEVPQYEFDGKTVLLYPGTDARTVKQLFSFEQHPTFKEHLLNELPRGHNLGNRIKELYYNETYEVYHVEKVPIERVVLIDSTWNQSRGIFCDNRLNTLPKIVLQNRKSQFWRHQKGSPRWYLSTVEALHQVLLELHLLAWGRSERYVSSLALEYPVHTEEHNQCHPYTGQYDNLLYFFKFMYEKLHTLYKHDNMLSYKRPMK